jgi:tetratricopeptide (TPR) repeat protein
VTLVALAGGLPAAAAPAKKSSAAAQARAQAKAEVAKAQLDYELGRFEKALEGYTRAYELVPAPALLFNLGQCHRNLKNYDRAIFFFQGYLREQANLSRDQRELTEDLITECKAELERQNIAAAAAVASSPPPLSTTPPQLSLPPPRLAAASMPSSSLVSREADRSREQEHTPRERSIVHRWWFWTAIGGAAAVAAGAVAYYATGDVRLVPPSGSVGWLDRR